MLIRRHGGSLVPSHPLPTPGPVRHRGRVAVVALALALLLMGTSLEPASAAAPASATHGAGTNKPAYNNGAANYFYKCKETALGGTVFKITGANIVMWSKGARIKGFQFKYRLVADGTDGQPQWWSNWSDNAATSFPQGSVQTLRMNAGPLGQSFDPAASWDFEVKLKYPRSLRHAYRYKYRLNLPSPAC